MLMLELTTHEIIRLHICHESQVQDTTTIAHSRIKAVYELIWAVSNIDTESTSILIGIL